MIKFRFFLFLLAYTANSAFAQTIDLSQFSNLKFRNIGPFKGGRSLAVAGHTSSPNTFYFGAVGGGIWKTEDGGKLWHCISDSTFKSSSVGALSISTSDPKTIYAGMGETDIRGNISFGDGMYKSTNSGKKWQKIGLENTFAIANIVIHPKDPNTVFVSALGNVFKPNADRGVFRTKDGGKTWQKILYKSDSAGCINIAMDPNDPNILFASLWQAYRSPWSMVSGGRHSGLYKSIDGGESWKNISQNEGMPKGILGKICMAISPVNSDRVFAMIENKNGGLFRSDDGGETWLKITEEKAIKQRPWYFSAVYCHPKNQDILFVLNVAYHKSVDGGKTFSEHWAQHGDNHDMWINPDNTDIMIIGNDGGGTVSYNGGLSWSQQDLPTAQFYHVSIDKNFPYKLYGAQQDNSSIAISSRSFAWEINKSDWYTCAWGESGYVTVHPFKPEITFGGNYSGALYRYDKSLGHTTSINVYPEDGLGDGALKLKHRFQWTYPLLFSPFSTPAKPILYATSQNVHRSYDEGLHWETISPDLTRNDKSKQQASGGPISKDNTGVETYNTIFTVAESTVEAGILWAGSDDGLVHVSSNHGKEWKNVSPIAIAENSQISIIEASHFNKQKAYVAATRFKLGESFPMLFKTSDFGKTWQKIDKGLPKNSITRVIREDPAQEGLLFCGTETGLYISFNDGESWQNFNQNLPNTPVHDIAIHETEHDVILATHGRGFWILDNISFLYDVIKQKSNPPTIGLKCRNTFNANGGTYEDANMQAGVNAPCGLVIDYFLTDTTSKEIKLKISNGNGDSIAIFSSKRDKNYAPVLINNDFHHPKTNKAQGMLSTDKGLNRFVWNMKTADLIAVEGDGKIMWGASLSGPLANPDKYSIELLYGDALNLKTSCFILPDPRFKEPSIENYIAKKHLLDSIIAQVNAMHKTINQMRAIKKQINEFIYNLNTTNQQDSMRKHGKIIIDSLSSIENELIQSNAKNIQDLLNYPMKLNNKMATLIDQVDAFHGEVPQQYYTVFHDLSIKVNHQLHRYKSLVKNEIKAFNTMAKTIALDAIKLKE